MLRAGKPEESALSSFKTASITKVTLLASLAQTSPSPVLEQSLAAEECRQLKLTFEQPDEEEGALEKEKCWWLHNQAAPGRLIISTVVGPTGAKKREAINFSMANHGLGIVEKDATHLSKDWKETRNEEKKPCKSKICT